MSSGILGIAASFEFLKKDIQRRDNDAYENRRSIETGIRHEPFCFGIGINALGGSLGKEIK